jgi:hypothetical protein
VVAVDPIHVLPRELIERYDIVLVTDVDKDTSSETLEMRPDNAHHGRRGRS